MKRKIFIKYFSKSPKTNVIIAVRNILIKLSLKNQRCICVANSQFKLRIIGCNAIIIKQIQWVKMLKQQDLLIR